jgi:hypothetical protein
MNHKNSIPSVLQSQPECKHEKKQVLEMLMTLKELYLVSREVLQIKTADNEWCDETRKFELKTDLVTIANKKYLLRHGTGIIWFCVRYLNDYTIAYLYEKKTLSYLSSKRWDKKLTPAEIKTLIFDKTFHIAYLKKIDNKPYKVSLKHKIVTLAEFKDKFKPNDEIKKSYTSTSKDAALSSLSNILSDVEFVKFDAGTFSSAINSAIRSISHDIHKATKKEKLISVYAIWSNFDPESRLVMTKDSCNREPLYYQYETITCSSQSNTNAILNGVTFKLA